MSPMAGDDFADLEHGATETQPHQAAASSGGFVLAVVEGPDAGAQLQVDEDPPSPLLIGQGPACALRLRDPRVSRQIGRAHV